MKYFASWRFATASLLGVMLVAALLFVSKPAATQNAAGMKKFCLGCSVDGKATPRTAEGHPDLSGMWGGGFGAAPAPAPAAAPAAGAAAAPAAGGGGRGGAAFQKIFGWLRLCSTSVRNITPKTAAEESASLTPARLPTSHPTTTRI